MKAISLLCIGFLACVSFYLVDDSQTRFLVLAFAIIFVSHITHRISGLALQHFGERHRLLINITAGAVCVVVYTLLLLTALSWTVVGVAYLVAFGVCAVAYCVYFYVRRLFGILLHWPEDNGASE